MVDDATKTLRRLTAIVAIQWAGATLGLPLLPLYLEHRHGTPSVVGLVMASFFVAGVATQFYFGRLVDRFGRRRILTICLVAYGVASMFFVLPVDAAWLIGARAVQGACAGAIEVTALSAVAALFEESKRGRAVSRVLAAQLFGIVVGPLAGVAANVDQVGLAYFFTGVVSIAAAFVARRTNLGDREIHEGPLPAITMSRRFVGVLFAASANGLCVGVYEGCWSLLMHAHHASSLQIRLSWVVFGLPWVLLSRTGGWLADHADRKLIAALGLANGAFFLALYPHIHNNVVMLFLGSLESVGTSLSMPALASLMSQGALDRELGRRQGLMTMSSTASLAIAASVSGFLFSIDPALPFTIMAVISIAMAIMAVTWWRGVPGRVLDPVDA